ncbi:MAG: PaaX family transcriptional regulator C-terminal domain-containing protein [Paracoccus sp. (in: a-proteobacteria)]|nr:PaaX family transcriptional regulator C-terminal domain-containing protein [Paracoccus sp. (in: a-proteobacteria)]
MSPAPALVPVIEGMDITAASFIVTVYGDVVVPRGEVLWMGSLIETCGRIGIRENLVRTAVSRLVAAGQLEGERQGRRSFYRLAPAARAEFARATARLYAHGTRPRAWIVFRMNEVPDKLRRDHHMAHLGGSCWIAPDWGALPPGAGLVLRVPDDHPEAMPGIADLWDLDSLGLRYERVLALFQPVADALQSPQENRAQSPLSAQDALILRLLLVHAYRAALLRDPLLPSALLPTHWAGSRARTLFRNLYLLLTPLAEAGIGTLEAAQGTLPAQSTESRKRLQMLG